MADQIDAEDGETCVVELCDFRCPVCGAQAAELTLTLEATGTYCVRNPRKITRKWLHYHNPACDCTPEIWLPGSPPVDD